MFQLLGVLCEQFPANMISYSTRLVDIYTKTLKAEVIVVYVLLEHLHLYKCPSIIRW